MNRYTVIGSAGFVGANVVRILRDRGVDAFCPVRDSSALFGHDLGTVIFCAGVTGDYRSRPFATVEAHVSLLAEVIERASFERIIYVSSTRVYDLLPDGIGTENRPIPVNPGNTDHLYELSKMLGENLTLNQTEGRGVVARLSYVFGWDDDAQGFLSEWLRLARRGKSMTLDSSPFSARDYIHVKDVATALIGIAGGRTGGIINVARGEALSNGAIAELFRQHGWQVAFSRETGITDRSIAIDTTILGGLGLAAQPALSLISGYLSSLS